MQKIIEAYTKMWKNFAVFSGRTNAPDYWWAALGHLIVSVVLGILVYIVPFLIFVIGLYGLATILPMLSMEIRRLHDTGKSAWYLLLNLIPAVGEIIILIFLVLPSQLEDNQYGPAGESI